MISAVEGRHRAPAPVAAPALGDTTVALSGPVELLLEAVTSVAADLDLDGVLRRILQAACVLTEAPAGLLSLLTEDRAIVFGASPSGDGGSLRRTLVVDGAPFARLLLAGKAGGFQAREVLMLERLLAAAGAAVGNAVAHRAAVGVERERIARDLHDTVIQRLYAAGMRLQSARGTADHKTVLDRAVRDLDGAMRDLRATVFELRRGRHGSLLAEIEGLLEEYAEPLGFRPALHHSGPVDTAPSRVIGDQVLATVREALSNILKHARATCATVEVHASMAWLLVRVTDDGVGIGGHEAGVLGSGLANLRTRAERLGGVFRIGSGGLDWLVPTGH